MQESVVSIQMKRSVCIFCPLCGSIGLCEAYKKAVSYKWMQGGSTINWEELTQTYEMAEKCILTNYYGAKETTEAFLPLLQLSNSPRIVNVSSQAGLLKVHECQNFSLNFNPFQT